MDYSSIESIIFSDRPFQGIYIFLSLYFSMGLRLSNM